MKIAPEIQIENARQIVDTRNWVIHGYDKVDDVVSTICLAFSI